MSGKGEELTAAMMNKVQAEPLRSCRSSDRRAVWYGYVNRRLHLKMMVRMLVERRLWAFQAP